MTDSTLQIEVLHRIALLKSDGYDVVIVHGGGPFIKEALSRAGIQSEFIDGHRITTPEAYAYVEMALKGQVNSTLTGILNNLGFKAVGLSGKDAHMVTAAKRWHYRHSEKGREQIDIGLVGDVKSVDTSFINLLLQNDIIPVITCLAAGDEGNSYNINGDMFAGHIAGALGAREYIILTDVDGLLRDISDPASLISDLRSNDIHEMIRDGVIAGGMLPKIESCTIALKLGCAAARIINGTQPDQINNLPQSGTRITL
ncbi:MAG: acetylglutamate kinase [Bacteroidetes bacterium]|nr:acetylglutamate kinase [Bacteroidota bacterium]